jgi:methanesulfonate monooxygenase subunit beta
MSAEIVRGVIHRACRLLDAEDWDNFLALCASNFAYQVVAYSPEIRRDMIWFDQDKDGLKALFEMVPQHLRRIGTLLRHVSVGEIERQADGSWLAISTFQCFHTDQDVRTLLLAVGRYDDRLSADAGPLLLSRTTRLETRDLGVGSHVPL